jgi:hypothetical protein
MNYLNEFVENMCILDASQCTACRNLRDAYFSYVREKYNIDQYVSVPLMLKYIRVISAVYPSITIQKRVDATYCMGIGLQGYSIVPKSRDLQKIKERKILVNIDGRSVDETYYDGYNEAKQEVKRHPYAKDTIMAAWTVRNRLGLSKDEFSKCQKLNYFEWIYDKSGNIDVERTIGSLAFNIKRYGFRLHKPEVQNPEHKLQEVESLSEITIGRLLESSTSIRSVDEEPIPIESDWRFNANDAIRFAREAYARTMIDDETNRLDKVQKLVDRRRRRAKGLKSKVKRVPRQIYADQPKAFGLVFQILPSWQIETGFDVVRFSFKYIDHPKEKDYEESNWGHDKLCINGHSPLKDQKSTLTEVWTHFRQNDIRVRRLRISWNMLSTLPIIKLIVELDDKEINLIHEISVEMDFGNKMEPRDREEEYEEEKEQEHNEEAEDIDEYDKEQERDDEEQSEIIDSLRAIYSPAPIANSPSYITSRPSPLIFELID